MPNGQNLLFWVDLTFVVKFCIQFLYPQWQCKEPWNLRGRVHMVKELINSIIDSSTCTSDSPNSPLLESQSSETPPPAQWRKRLSLSPTFQNLLTTKENTWKSLSQAQRDQLLMNAAKEDVIMKKEMLKSFQRSTKTMEDSISKMTDCLTSLGDGIATGMRLLANALAGNHSNAAVNHHTPA